MAFDTKVDPLLGTTDALSFFRNRDSLFNQLLTLRGAIKKITDEKGIDEDLFSSFCTDLLKCLSSGFPDISAEAAEQLVYLLKFDPITEKTFSNLDQLAHTLSGSLENPDADKEMLTSLYAATIDGIFSHLKKGTLTDFPSTLKELFSKQFQEEKKEGVNFRYVKEWGVQIATTSEKTLKEKIEKISLTHFSNPLTKMTWYEVAYLLRQRATQMIVSGDRSQAIVDKIAQITLEQSSNKEGEPIPILLSAAHVYRQIVLYYNREDKQKIYQSALGTNMGPCGLMTLASLSEEENEEFESELIEIFFAVLDQIYFSEVSKLDDQTSQTFEEGLLAALETLHSKKVRARFLRKLESDQGLFSRIEKVWENKKKGRVAELEKRISELEKLAKESLIENSDIEELKEKKSRYEEVTFSEAIEAIVGKELSLKEVKGKSITRLVQEAQDDYDSFGHLMVDAVQTPWGTVYSEKAILAWLEVHKVDPIEDKPLTKEELTPHESLRNRLIEKSKRKKLSSFRSFKPKHYAVHAQLFHAVKKLNFFQIKESIKNGGHPEYFKDNQGETALSLAKRLDESLFRELSLLVFGDKMLLVEMTEELGSIVGQGSAPGMAPYSILSVKKEKSKSCVEAETDKAKETVAEAVSASHASSSNRSSSPTSGESSSEKKPSELLPFDPNKDSSSKNRTLKIILDHEMKAIEQAKATAEFRLFLAKTANLQTENEKTIVKMEIEGNSEEEVVKMEIEETTQLFEHPLQSREEQLSRFKLMQEIAKLEEIQSEQQQQLLHITMLKKELLASSDEETTTQRLGEAMYQYETIRERLTQLLSQTILQPELQPLEEQELAVAFDQELTEFTFDTD